LSLYLREVSVLQSKHKSFVSSHWLAQHLGLSDAQVRRDLSYFGQFGTSGRGYEIARLKQGLAGILGTHGRTWRVALAGVGNLGSALLAHRGFQERGFVFALAVDSDPCKIGRVVEGIVIQPFEHLPRLLKQQPIDMGLIAVPMAVAQQVCDEFVRGGVKSILNFAPVHLDVPDGVPVRTVDLTIELEGLAFHLARKEQGHG
jgi:redox-sensing transcriptional repressor